MQRPPRAKDAEDIPVGAIVETPLGHRARVVGYRGAAGTKLRRGRGHRTWLVCVYVHRVDRRDRRQDTVLLLPELVRVVETTQQEAA